MRTAKKKKEKTKQRFVMPVVKPSFLVPKPALFPDHKFSTDSGLEVKAYYTPEDTAAQSYTHDVANPGEYPFTRGNSAEMYRKGLWKLQPFAGYGTAKQTNERFKQFLNWGATGLGLRFDNPTTLGYDADHPRAFGETGRAGVAANSLADFREIFEGIEVSSCHPNLEANAIAPFAFAMLLATAEEQGTRPKELKGTIQNDLFRDYLSKDGLLFTEEASIRLFTDVLKFALDRTPQACPLQVSGIAFRRMGANASQEVAYTLAAAFAYLEIAVGAGIELDQLASRISFAFSLQTDLFEETAKFRAARRLWARWMREKYQSANPESWKLRFRAETLPGLSGVLTGAHYRVRSSVEVLAAALGGAESVHVNYPPASLYESEMSLRTQQIIAYESSVVQTADPAGGSFYLETLTSKIEEEAENHLKKMQEVGGFVRSLQNGFLKKEISGEAARFAADIAAGSKIVVGDRAEADKPAAPQDHGFEREQIERLQLLKKKRVKKYAEKALKDLKKTAAGKANLVPKLVECAKSSISLGEMVSALQEVLGEYKPPSVF